MSDLKRLAESIQYQEEKRFNKLVFKPAELELCGKGRSAYVFSYKKDGKKMALKVFFLLIETSPAKRLQFMKNFPAPPIILRFTSLEISIF